MAGALVAPVLRVGWVGTEICFSVFVVGPAWIGHGGRGWAGCSVVGGIASPFAFRYFSFISIGFLVSCIYSLRLVLSCFFNLFKFVSIYMDGPL